MFIMYIYSCEAQYRFFNNIVELDSLSLYF